MRVKLGLMALATALTAPAQMRMTVAQLVSFVKSSIELKHPDKQVAEYLGKVRLTERLEDRTIEELQGLGAGSRTVQALRELRDAARPLPPAPPPPPPKAAAPIPPPGAEEQQRILDRVREYALGYVKRLPDFICLQVTRRYVDPSGLEFWHQQDVVTARLSYFEQKEDYKLVLVNNRPTDISYDSLGGSTSTGEFGSMLKEVFDPQSEAEFRWERWATLRGRRAHVYRYRVPKHRSRWNIVYEKTISITPAYHGLVYVDRDNHSVMRLTLAAEGIPPSFPVQEANTTLDYDSTEISGLKFILPLKAVVRMRSGKFLSKNEVEFRMYRKFTADTVITFDTVPEPLPEDQTTEQPPRQ